MRRSEASSIELVRTGLGGSSTPRSADTPSPSPKVDSKRALFTRTVSPIIKHRWFSWIPQKSTWSNWKPVIRSAVAVSMITYIAYDSFGYAGFFSSSLKLKQRLATQLVRGDFYCADLSLYSHRCGDHPTMAASDTES